jgi:hypothetical protein
LPTREAAAKKERERNAGLLSKNPNAKVNHHHHVFLGRWWLLSWPRPELISQIAKLNRYIVCGQVTKRPVFELISSAIRPNAALIVFPLADDYSFGILQSSIHWRWFQARCSTLKRDFRYTSDTVFDSFPWPQDATLSDVRKVAKAATNLRAVRSQVMQTNGLSRRQLYRQLDKPGISPVRTAHEGLDDAVRSAYGIGPKRNVLAFLLDLNHQAAKLEAAGKTIQGPGLPKSVKDPKPFITTDCIQAPSL